MDKKIIALAVAMHFLLQTNPVFGIHASMKKLKFSAISERRYHVLLGVISMTEMLGWGWGAFERAVLIFRKCF